ncbi:MAG: peptidoglycan-binding protein [bacterium]|nr:peptidoglycan-binding protein [bacterium]
MLSATSFTRRLIRDVMKHAFIFGIASLCLSGVIGPATGILSGVVFGKSYEDAEILAAVVMVAITTLGTLVGAIFGGNLAASDRRWIRRAQQQLKSQGFYHGPPDGLLNDDTKQALIEFQELEGLTKSGRFDDATMSRLGL